MTVASGMAEDISSTPGRGTFSHINWVQRDFSLEGGVNWPEK